MDQASQSNGQWQGNLLEVATVINMEVSFEICGQSSVIQVSHLARGQDNGPYGESQQNYLNK